MIRSEALLRAVFSNLNDIEEWRLADGARASAKGYPREFASNIIDDHGIIFVDVAIDAASGLPVCHEVNGPNAVGSDALTGNSATRAESEARQTMARAAEMGFLAGGRVRRPFATIHAHQHWPNFRTGGEFYPRVLRYADRLDQLLGGDGRGRVAIRAPRDAPRDEDISVVVGDVPSVGALLEIDAAGAFRYRDRPVAFVGNPNLLWELVRLGRLAAHRGRIGEENLRVLHAWRLAHVIHDKGLQQRLFQGTGIAPLAHFEAHDRSEAFELTRARLRHGAVVLKPNAGSGGTGVHVLVPSMSDEAVARTIERVIADMAAKYGANAEAMAFPLRGFDFVQSTPCPMADGGHLWDLRVAIEFEPGRARVYPVSLRLAPEAFDPATFHEHRDMWVSNVSGRQVTCLKSALDDELLGLVGVTPGQLETIFAASLRWLERAWDGAVRDAGPGGRNFEEACEDEDPSFYAGRFVTRGA